MLNITAPGFMNKVFFVFFMHIKTPHQCEYICEYLFRKEFQVMFFYAINETETKYINEMYTF